MFSPSGAGLPRDRWELWQGLTREQAARRTRNQIRDAAARLFVQQGYALTTMRQIADNAEVSERTAYLAFPSKLDLFMEVIGIATAGDDQPIPIAERPEFQSALSERDGQKALGILVSMVTNFNERSGALVMAAHESAGADEALREAVMQGERASPSTEALSSRRSRARFCTSRRPGADASAVGSARATGGVLD